MPENKNKKPARMSFWKSPSFRWIGAALVLIVAVGAVWFGLRKQEEPEKAPSNYVLSEDGTTISRVGEQEPFLYASALPDTVPSWFNHVLAQRFDNRRFHFMCVSPNQRYIAFACGEGDQWIGIVDMEKGYVKFMMFGVQTSFYAGDWTPDNKYLSMAFWGPDRRMCVVTLEPTIFEEPLTPTLNIWYEYFYKGEKFKPGEWDMTGDTTYSFSILSADGDELKEASLPLRMKNPQK
jgi:hypothetical protein